MCVPVDETQHDKDGQVGVRIAGTEHDKEAQGDYCSRTGRDKGAENAPSSSARVENEEVRAGRHTDGKRGGFER